MATIQGRGDEVSSGNADDFHKGMLDNGQGGNPASAGKADAGPKRKRRKRRREGERYRPVPPVEHRFQKGESGNPYGRPRKRKQLAPVGLITAIEAELKKKHKVKQGDKVVSMSTLNMVAKKLIHDAVAGDSPARTRTIKLLAQMGVIDAAAEMDAIKEQVANMALFPAYTPEMEAALTKIDAEFLEDDQPDEPEPS